MPRLTPRTAYLDQTVRYAIRSLEQPDLDPHVLKAELQLRLDISHTIDDRPTEALPPPWPYPPGADKQLLILGLTVGIVSILVLAYLLIWGQP